MKESMLKRSNQRLSEGNKEHIANYTLMPQTSGSKT